MGESIAEWCAGAEWVAANFGIPTFLHRGAGGNITPTSSPDVTLGHHKLLRRVTWRVVEDAGSDHLPCFFTVYNSTTSEQKRGSPKWSYDKTNWDGFRSESELLADQWRVCDKLGVKCDKLHKAILAAAHTHIPRGLRKQAKCWWTDKVDLAVRDRRIARAVAQHTRLPADRTAWNRASKACKRVILDSKRDLVSTLSSATAPERIHRVYKAINNNAEPRRIDVALEVLRSDGSS